jgi:hypothetical protein
MKTDTTMSRRRLLASVPAVAAAGVPAAATALGGLSTGATADPIYAAIEVHREAYRTFDAAVATFGVAEASDDDEAYEAANANVLIASNAEKETAAALIEIVPTTLAGASAVIDNVIGYYRGELTHGGRRYDIFSDQGELCEFLATIGETIKAAGEAS